jgi:hypothetical protein
MHAEQSLQGRAAQNAVDNSSILDTLFTDDQPAGFAGFELHIHEQHLDDLQYGLIEEIIDWFEDDDLHLAAQVVCLLEQLRSQMQ